MALAVIHNLTRVVNTALARKKLQEENKLELLDLLKRFDSVLNIFGTEQQEMLDSEIQSFLKFCERCGMLGGERLAFYYCFPSGRVC